MAENAVQEVGKHAEQVYVLSSGVKFTTRPVPSLRIYAAQQAIPLPKPPLKQIKHGGQTYVTEDLDNEIFRELYEEAQRKRNMAALDLIFRRGVKLLPGQLPQDDAWLRDLMIDLGDLLSPYLDENGNVYPEYKEYLYLRFVAVQSAEDFQTISNAVTLREEEVQAAVENFQ